MSGRMASFGILDETQPFATGQRQGWLTVCDPIAPQTQINTAAENCVILI